jgi:CBS domain containing-hemolysin-like protein
MNDDDGVRPENGRKQSLFGRLRRIFGETGREDDDFSADIENGDGEPHDALTSARREMIERVIAFDEKKVFDVMAPRADIFAVDIDMPLDELVGAFAEAGHSRLPIYRGDLDDPVGMAHIKDVVALLSNGSKAHVDGEPVLKAIRRELLYAPPSMRVTDLLLRMQASRIHMALVIDEYGGTDGLVTIEDLIEEIVGEINDEHDEDDEASVSIAPDGGWFVDARVELEAFTEETGVRLEMEEDEDLDTVGGYVVSLAGRVPRRGEIIACPSGLDIEVTEADARKVRRVRIQRSRLAQNEAAE